MLTIRIAITQHTMKYIALLLFALAVLHRTIGLESRYVRTPVSSADTTDDRKLMFQVKEKDLGPEDEVREEKIPVKHETKGPKENEEIIKPSKEKEEVDHHHPKVSLYELRMHSYQVFIAHMLRILCHPG